MSTPAPTTPGPGGVPAHTPQPEVPAREHPVPGPVEQPAGLPPETPTPAPPGPGPVARA